MLDRITPFVTLVISLGIAGTSTAQELRVEQRCHTILRDEISDAIESANHARINLARELPSDQVRGLLVKGLMSDDAQVRLTVAEILAQQEPKNADVIKQHLLGLKLTTQIDSVRRTAILMSFGDQKAAGEIAHLAELHGAQVATDGFVCPMQCAKPQEKAGRCPVCAMSLVEASRTATFEDWEARIYALRVLQESGKKATANARLVLTSDANAWARLEAAGIWAKEEPKKALPHLRLYLGTPYHNEALWTIAQNASAHGIDLFEAELKRPASSAFNRFAAYHGLLNAGNMEYLRPVRELASQDAKTEESQFEMMMAIGLLGDFGSEADQTILVSLLDTNLKVDAAKALLKLRHR